ncbi:MAG: DEAD/DEAH box helicase [Candidatus Hydrogenedens sp.]|nr:DEAD/DEAH box helicase [Candidatus Hydrogenedens sp.]
MSDTPTPGFDSFGLSQPITKALSEIGYETPSPIQAMAIPHILEGRDVLGQAQTGTGKTAAFALPILSNIDLEQWDTQVLVLTPTRELALQVAEAFQSYARHMKGLHVLPIYGGQGYGAQLRQLERGAHIVVGTPGRVMDHMRRETLNLSELRTLVLDEADEMLRMGFIDDVSWILEQTPAERQIALFSATMPPVIKKIAQKHLQNPEEITIKVRTSTAETIRQRYWMVGHHHKLDALTRILDFEVYDGMLVFVKTKAATAELAEKLEARGHSCAALNGDVAQRERERTVENFKSGKIDLLIATDVAARGLDVDRISHVINYDIPYDTESYVHRIGRTGRAGRKGEAILFVTPREKGMLNAIERATRQQIELLRMPSTEEINVLRVAQFKQRITDILADEDLGLFASIVEEYIEEHDKSAVDVAAALARMAQGDEPMLLKADPRKHQQPRTEQFDRPDRGARDERPARRGADLPMNMEHYRLEVGASHGATPGAIVGAIANETGLEGRYIGQIDIYEDFTVVDLPRMPADIFRLLQTVRVAGQPLKISRLEPGDRPARPRRGPAGPPSDGPGKKPGPKKFGPPKGKPGGPKGNADFKKKAGFKKGPKPKKK